MKTISFLLHSSAHRRKLAPNRSISAQRAKASLHQGRDFHHNPQGPDCSPIPTPRQGTFSSHSLGSSTRLIRPIHPPGSSIRFPSRFPSPAAIWPQSKSLRARRRPSSSFLKLATPALRRPVPCAASPPCAARGGGRRPRSGGALPPSRSPREAPTASGPRGPRRQRSNRPS